MPRTWLLQRSHGRHVSTNDLRDALREASIGLTDSAPITSHRMRHSYATEMLSAGMSLPTLMRILGHRSYHMTLRYAAITDEALGKEYHQALAQIEKRYRLPTPPVVAKAPDPAEMFEHQTSRGASHVGWTSKRSARRFGSPGKTRLSALTRLQNLA